MSTLKFTGERLVSSVQDESSAEHLHRYALAMQYCSGKSVVDIASGEGYGSALLSTVATTVTGVDIDPEAVSFASKKYQKKNLTYKTGNATAIPVADQSVDVVVSFETIEHHDKHAEMILEIKRILKPDGLLIISTPDRVYYSEERNYQNPFHVKELDRQEFQSLLHQQFPNVKLYGQRLVYGSLLVDADMGKSDFEFYEGDFTKVNNRPMKPYYYVAFASASTLPEIKASFFSAEDVLIKRFQDIFNSPSFRLGNILLKPASLVLRLFGLKK